MNKLRRRELEYMHFKRRVAMRNNGCYVNSNGEQVYGIKTVDLLKDCKWYELKHHSAPCSCYMCSRPDLKYNRAKVKSVYLKEINSNFANS